MQQDKQSNMSIGADPIQKKPFKNPSPNTAHLRILETTDLHMHIWPYDYYSDTPNDMVGLARTATLIAQARSEAQNTLLCDNGDFLQGTPMADYIAHKQGLSDGDPHPIMAAMNTLGYTAATLGNHEFNYGLDFLQTAISGAEFPIVSANIVRKMGQRPRDDEKIIDPYVILERTIIGNDGKPYPIRIGVIGFLPPQVLTWDHHLAGQVETRDILRTAQAHVPEMKAAGADIVIALSHSGIGAETKTDDLENATIPLAEIDGIDVVLAGHIHQVFPSLSFANTTKVDAQNGLIHGKPTVMAGFFGSHLGVIDLLLNREHGNWRITDSSVETRAIAKRNPDSSITSLVDSNDTVLAATANAHHDTLNYIRQPVGKTSVPIHSFFALITDSPAVQIVSDAQMWFVRKMLAQTQDSELPLLSAAAPFKAGGIAGPDYYTNVPAGDLAIRNVADIYLYPNSIRAVKVNGDQLNAWLERSASIFNTISYGTPDQHLINPAFPSYEFDVISGVTYEIDVTQPPRFGPAGRLLNPSAQRIRNLKFQGTPVTNDMTFAVATNSYRASGGGNFPGADGTSIILKEQDTNRDIIIRYITEQGTLSPGQTQNWSFASVGEAVLFETSPKAVAHLSEIKMFDLRESGDGANGFRTFLVSV